jgi:hypothetical protein
LLFMCPLNTSLFQMSATSLSHKTLPTSPNSLPPIHRDEVTKQLTS